MPRWEKFTCRNQQAQIPPSKKIKSLSWIWAMNWTKIYSYFFNSCDSQVIHSALGIPILLLLSECNTNLAAVRHVWTQLLLFALQCCEIWLDLFQQTGYKGSPRAWSHFLSIVWFLSFFLPPIHIGMYQLFGGILPAFMPGVRRQERCYWNKWKVLNIQLF